MNSHHISVGPNALSLLQCIKSICKCAKRIYKCIKSVPDYPDNLRPLCTCWCVPGSSTPFRKTLSVLFFSNYFALDGMMLFAWPHFCVHLLLTGKVQYSVLTTVQSFIQEWSLACFLSNSVVVHCLMVDTKQTMLLDNVLLIRRKTLVLYYMLDVLPWHIVLSRWVFFVLLNNLHQ